MPRQRRKRHAPPAELGLIWKTPDKSWAGIEPLLREYRPGHPTGRKVTQCHAALSTGSSSRW